MRFTDHFNIQRNSSDDWFDPFLSLDTKLFLDPFLLYDDEFGLFKGSHDEVIAFFNSVFKMIARSGGSRSSLQWRNASNLLLFPEVEEICLGYTSQGTRGSGSGKGLSHVIANALWEAVLAGVNEITHFEEVRILREGIGADRISDITASLIRKRLAEYTLEISSRYHITTTTTRYLRGVYDAKSERWLPLEVNLPKNPINERPVLLVPRRYLRSLPTVDPDGFWEYCYDNENETLRNELSRDITRSVDKKTIINFARRHPEIRARYFAKLESMGGNSYDFEKDPKGLVKWYEAANAYCRSSPLELIVASQSDFISSLEAMIDQFCGFIRNNRGWSLLWNENRTSKAEESAQLLFLGIVQHYCRANNIDISREADIGRGPVDFKASIGYKLRALIEVKLARNTRFWNGLERQLPAYMTAEGIQIGYFIVVIYTEQDLRRLENIRARIREVNRSTGYSIKYFAVDARYGGPPSASRL